MTIEPGQQTVPCGAGVRGRSVAFVRHCQPFAPYAERFTLNDLGSTPGQPSAGRIDTTETSTSNPKQSFTPQLNPGVASSGFADHYLQV